MPPNDPQWGKRPNEGPPDLDEILRKLNQKLSGLFGRRPSGPSGPSEPTPPFSGPGNAFFGGSIAFIVVLILAVWLASGFYIVDEGRRGVVLRLGKYIETTMPGPRSHVPFPIESVEVVNVAGVRTVEVGYRGTPKNKQPQEALMLTDDENIVDVQFAIQYTLKSPEDFLFNNRNPDDNVLQAAETSIREVVGKSKMDFVLSQGRSEVASRVKQTMQHILDRYKTGINITTVNLQNVQAPEQVLRLRVVVRAGQDRERIKNEGQANATAWCPTPGVAARLTYEPTATSIGHRDGPGEPRDFRQIPPSTIRRGGTRGAFLDSRADLSNTIKVIATRRPPEPDQPALDKLMGLTQPVTRFRAGHGRAAAAHGPPAGPPRPAPAPDTRSRDAQRSRETIRCDD